MALISDAGTPLVSDPGYKLVREALAAGLSVTSIPGPSAALAALTSSGLPTDTFLFAGFLPVKGGPRRTRIEELKDVPATLVFFEAAQRLAKSLADLVEVLGAREAALAKELTKLYESVTRGTLPELAERLAQGPELKGEFVLVIAPPNPSEATGRRRRHRRQPESCADARELPRRGAERRRKIQGEAEPRLRAWAWA